MSPVYFDISAVVHRRAGLGRYADSLTHFREKRDGRPARVQSKVLLPIGPPLLPR